MWHDRIFKQCVKVENVKVYPSEHAALVHLDECARQLPAMFSYLKSYWGRGEADWVEGHLCPLLCLNLYLVGEAESELLGCENLGFPVLVLEFGFGEQQMLRRGLPWGAWKEMSPSRSSLWSVGWSGICHWAYSLLCRNPPVECCSIPMLGGFSAAGGKVGSPLWLGPCPGHWASTRQWQDKASSLVCISICRCTAISRIVVN